MGERMKQFINKYGLNVSEEESKEIEKKMQMITRETDGENRTILLQKNARCPNCAGTLKKYEHERSMFYKCINCGTRYTPIDVGLSDNELICKVDEPFIEVKSFNNSEDVLIIEKEKSYVY